MKIGKKLPFIKKNKPRKKKKFGFKEQLFIPPKKWVFGFQMKNHKLISSFVFWLWISFKNNSANVLLVGIFENTYVFKKLFTVKNAILAFFWWLIILLFVCYKKITKRTFVRLLFRLNQSWNMKKNSLFFWGGGNKIVFKTQILFCTCSLM